MPDGLPLKEMRRNDDAMNTNVGIKEIAIVSVCIIRYNKKL